MDTATLTALIGAIGILIGTIITSFVQYHTSKNKLKELQISYAHNSYDRQIESARNHLEDLYLPLYKEISSLLYHYTKYRNNYRITEDDKDKKIKNNDRDKLLNAISEFDKSIENIFKSGMTAYLVGVIEERVINLRDLLEQSKNENTNIVKRNVVVSLNTSVFGFNSSLKKEKIQKYSVEKSYKTHNFIMPKISVSSMPFLMWPFSIETETEMKILKAPLYSEEFETEFMKYITEIKRDILEVTLWVN